MSLATIALTRTKDVWVASFLQKAFTPAVVSDAHRVLDEVERTAGPTSLVFASSQKIFSGGIDLNWVKQNVKEGKIFCGLDIFSQISRLSGRLLTFPIPTVAAIGGHCYAAGLIFALSCDHRVMSDSAADVCMSEINLNLPLPRGGIEVLKAKLHPASVKDLLLTGQKISGPQAFERRIVDRLAAPASVLPTAIDFAQTQAPHATRRVTYGLIKQQIYGKAAESCEKAEASYDEAVAISAAFEKV